MKRQWAETTAPSGSTPPAAGASGGRAKRSKTSQACASCRKHKTRCELPAEPGVGRCHRCDVLQVACSFEGTDIIAAQVAAANGAAAAANTTAGDTPPAGVAPGDPSRYNPDAFSAEDLVMGPRMGQGDDPENGPGYWATSPMGAIWDIMRKRRASADGAVPPAPALPAGAEVLSEDEVHYLMNLSVPL
jgi:hypothetical protein